MPLKKKKVIKYLLRYAKREERLDNKQRENPINSDQSQIVFGQNFKINSYFTIIQLEDTLMSVGIYLYTGTKDGHPSIIKQEMMVNYSDLEKEDIKSFISLLQQVLSTKKPDLILEFEQGREVKNGPEGLDFDPENIHTTVKCQSRSRFSEEQIVFLQNLIISRMTELVSSEMEVKKDQIILKETGLSIKYTFDANGDDSDYYDSSLVTSLIFKMIVGKWVDCTLTISTGNSTNLLQHFFTNLCYIVKAAEEKSNLALIVLGDLISQFPNVNFELTRYTEPVIKPKPGYRGGSSDDDSDSPRSHKSSKSSRR